MSAVSFYTGEVSHIRVSGPRHRLRYRIAYVLVDLDRIVEANAHSRFLGVGKPSLMSVRARDHGDGDTEDLAGWVRDKAKAEGVAQDCARIELLTLPRMFGYVFNPISVYFLYDGNDVLHHILYEVNNTFGGRHFYLTRPNASEPLMPHHASKQLYVSPFFDVEGGYEFTIQPPAETVFLNINYLNKSGAKTLNARLLADRRNVTDTDCLKVLIGFPLMTMGVIAAIHWEALKLWIKGAKFRPEPKDKEDVVANIMPGQLNTPNQKRRAA